MTTIDAVLATVQKRDAVLDLMRDHLLADELESTMALIGMTWPQFEAHYYSVGEAGRRRVRDGRI